MFIFEKKNHQKNEINTDNKPRKQLSLFYGYGIQTVHIFLNLFVCFICSIAKNKRIIKRKAKMPDVI